MPKREAAQADRYPMIRRRHASHRTRLARRRNAPQGGTSPSSRGRTRILPREDSAAGAQGLPSSEKAHCDRSYRNDPASPAHPVADDSATSSSPWWRSGSRSRCSTVCTGRSGTSTRSAAALAALACFPLLARRRSPLAVFVFVTAASATLNGLGYGLGPPFGPTIALFFVATDERSRAASARPRSWCSGCSPSTSAAH